jgi:hypothetical protein
MKPYIIYGGSRTPVFYPGNKKVVNIEDLEFGIEEEQKKKEFILQTTLFNKKQEIQCNKGYN